MTQQDHYAVLGILQTATEGDIKQAYKKKALSTHPDKNGGTDAATRAFQAVQEAYNCLSDAGRRRTYDYTYKTSFPNSKPTNASSTGNATSPTSSTNTKTSSDIKEEEEFLAKWRAHTLRKSAIDNKRAAYKGVEARIADFERQMAGVKDEMQKRKEEVKRQTERTWIGMMLWGKLELSEKDILENEIKDNESLQKVSSLRIKIAKLEGELRGMECYKKDWMEWDRQETIRRLEETNLAMKKQRRREAEQAEERRKAAERARKAEVERQKREAEERRKAQEKAEKERLERLRKAQEEEKRYREEMERYWKKTEEEIVENERKQRERDKKLRESAKLPRVPPNKRTNPSSSVSTCSHKGWWAKVPLVAPKSCSNCHQSFKSFLFQCPGCQKITCARCRGQLKSNRSHSYNYQQNVYSDFNYWD
ncbi:hypothetical protein AA313_de0201677 [Arthrobotrys entomopaga]|nr:hypothetical protein AA313_de0201677 [Arthrobotrys entomopaga]